jgi:hypothetical protein
MDEDLLQSILHGKLEIHVKNLTFTDQLQLLRALLGAPTAASRLRIEGDLHPWVERLLRSSGLSVVLPAVRSEAGS